MHREDALPVFRSNVSVLHTSISAATITLNYLEFRQKCHRLIIRVLAVIETLAVLVFEDHEVVPVAVTGKTVVTVAFPRTVLGPNFPNQETGKGNVKTVSVVSEKRGIFDVFALKVPNGAAPGPGLGLGRVPVPGSTTTTTGPSKEKGLGSKAVSKTITITINKGTMRKDRDKRPSLPGIIWNRKHEQSKRAGSTFCMLDQLSDVYSRSFCSGSFT